VRALGGRHPPVEQQRLESPERCPLPRQWLGVHLCIVHCPSKAQQRNVSLQRTVPRGSAMGVGHLEITVADPGGLLATAYAGGNPLEARQRLHSLHRKSTPSVSAWLACAIGTAAHIAHERTSAHEPHGGPHCYRRHSGAGMAWPAGRTCSRSHAASESHEEQGLWGVFCSSCRAGPRTRNSHSAPEISPRSICRLRQKCVNAGALRNPLVVLSRSGEGMNARDNSPGSGMRLRS
jgi:hypothetical protein